MLVLTTFAPTGGAVTGVPVPQVGMDDEYVYVGYNECPVVSGQGPLEECTGPRYVAKIPLSHCTAVPALCGDPCTATGRDLCDPCATAPAACGDPCAVTGRNVCDDPCHPYGTVDACTPPCKVGNALDTCEGGCEAVNVYDPCDDPCVVGSFEPCNGDCGVLSYDPCRDPCWVNGRDVCEIPPVDECKPAGNIVDLCNPPPVWIPVVTGDLWVCKQYLDGSQGECILHVPLP